MLCRVFCTPAEFPSPQLPRRFRSVVLVTFVVPFLSRAVLSARIDKPSDRLPSGNSLIREPGDTNPFSLPFKWSARAASIRLAGP